MSFRVDLEIFRGPLDLLLYLVRKQELDVVDIPISLITDQFLEYVTVLEKLDVNAVGDFLEMASILIEIKSQMVLPRTEDEEESQLEDPRQELVQRLLDYKKYRDAASMLEEQSRQWQEHFTRVSSDVPPRRRDLADEPLQEIELWDLVGTFGRILREQELSNTSTIIYDDTPIEIHMEHIQQHLQEKGRTSISDLFKAGMPKSALIGVFLAMLELVRHQYVIAEQDNLHGDIWIVPGTLLGEKLDRSKIDNYAQATDTGEADDGPSSS